MTRHVVGHSMVPVLPPGTRVWGLRWYRTLNPGDVVVFVHEDKEKIKRVSLIDEDRIFVLGDHPETSTDSRHFDWLGTEVVKAKIIWPRTKQSAE